MTKDIVFAVRLFLRERGLFGVTLAGLALAIGVSTAVFTVLNAVAFRGSGVADPASVYSLSLASRLMGPVAQGTALSGSWSYADYQRLRQNTASATVAATTGGYSKFWREPDQAAGQGLGYAVVSGTYFEVMGGGAQIGRVLVPGDDVAGAQPVVVLSHTFWTRTLHEDASVIGRTVHLDDAPFVVVGVAKRFFTGPTDGGPPPPMWIPIAAGRDLEIARSTTRAAATEAAIRGLRNQSALTETDQARLLTLEAKRSTPIQQWNPAVTVHARPLPGVSKTQLGLEVIGLATAFAADRGQAASPDRPAVLLESMEERYANGALAPRVVFMVAGAIGLVVLLACANLANLLLAGAVRRGREIATRLALGASRWRIVRQLLVESLVLSLLGGAAGLLMATWFAPLFAKLAWRSTESLDLAPDPTTYLFVTGMAIVIGISAGLAPARYSRRGDLTSALKADQPGASGLMSRTRLRSILIGGQAAASIVLLVVAALFTRVAVHAATADLGFDVNHLVQVSVGLGGGYDHARVESFWAAALDRIRRLPGVAAAALTDAQPFLQLGQQRWKDGQIGTRETTSAEYFDAIGVRVIRGRTYSNAEVRNHEAVAVISESVARRYWGNDNPINGDLERVWGPADRPGSSRGILRKPAGTRVVGVVADTTSDLDNFDAPAIYLPSESLHPNTQLVVRAAADPASIVGPVRDALRSVDPEQTPGFFLIRDRFRAKLEPGTRMAVLSAIIGATALGLAAIGLFGVTAFVAGQRRREIGVRIALGAEQRDVVRMLVRDSLRPVVAGLACGLMVALWAGRILEGALSGVSGWDPVAIVTGVSILLAAAFAAAYLPARRAARVDPAIELRAQ